MEKMSIDSKISNSKIKNWILLMLQVVDDIVTNDQVEYNKHWDLDINALFKNDYIQSIIA